MLCARLLKCYAMRREVHIHRDLIAWCYLAIIAAVVPAQVEKKPVVDIVVPAADLHGAIRWWVVISSAPTFWF